MKNEKELLERANSPFSIYYKLKWHKFLIYFSLWFRAVACILRACNLIFGLQWGEYKEDIYSLQPKIAQIDILFGILFIALAIFIVHARFKLASFHPSSVSLLLTQFILFPTLSNFYARAINTAAEVELLDLSEGAGLFISAIILMIVSYFYYKKRYLLFIK